MEARTAATWTLLGLSGALLLAFASQDLRDLGPYYDEAFLAQQARDFVTPESAGTHPPGVSDVELFGRRFPLRNAAYLGALKSQLSIPGLFILGDDLAGWRLTTLATALAAAALCFLGARRCFGAPTAGLATLLLLWDPSLYFFGLYEWGPFTTLLLCRGAGLLLLCRGWQEERRPSLALGGVFLGLGVFCRADFALIVAAAGLALVWARFDVIREAWTRRRGDAAIAVGAAVLAGSPMLFSLQALLATSQGIADRGGLLYKAQVLWSTLDGSHFYRVVAEGGLFDELFASAAPAGLFGIALLLAWLWLGIAEARAEARDPGRRFLLLAAPLLALAMWALPGAVRAHHSLNLMPLGHLILARAAVDVMRTAKTPARVACATAVLVVLVSNLRVSFETRALIDQTGGRGRFSSAIQDFAAGLGERGDVVSLDWGFHEPLLLLSTRGPASPGSGASLEEPIWAVGAPLQAGRPWVRLGDARDVYLVHDAPYDLFGFGPRFLASARRLGPEAAAIEPYRDREGEVAFYAVRFAFAHRLAYNGSAFFVGER